MSSNSLLARSGQLTVFWIGFALVLLVTLIVTACQPDTRVRGCALHARS